MTILTILAGCSSNPAVAPGDSLEVPGAPVERVSVPLMGGVAAANQEWVAGSDVDADRVELLALFRQGAREVVFPEGWAPGPLAWDGEGRLQVLLRGTGSVAVIDPGSRDDDGFGPSLVDLRPVCPAPRGLGWDADRDRMWVACAGGELVGFGRHGRAVRYRLDGDLRDVVVLEDGRAAVSRFRSAEVLTVDLDTGEIVGRSEAPGWTDPKVHATFSPRVARRMVGWGGRAVLMYQLHQDGPIDAPGGPLEAGYGSTGGCGSVVRTGLATFDGDGFPAFGQVDAPLPIDFAAPLGPVGSGADAFPSAGHLALPNAVVSDARPTTACSGKGEMDLADLITGVADSDGGLFLVERDPFRLVPFGTPVPAAISMRSTADLGLRLFHDAPRGVACASCHPEGADDGHVWDVIQDGARRTQALGGGGISRTAPFHWDGSLADFSAVYFSIGQGRMGLPTASVEDLDQLEAWLDHLPEAPTEGPPPDAARVDRGADLFASVGCAECHSGPRFSNGASADVGTGGTFQVPSLLGVGARLPVMHDGCADSLRRRFVDRDCGGGDLHGRTSELSDSEVDDLVAYLETL